MYVYDLYVYLQYFYFNVNLSAYSYFHTPHSDSEWREYIANQIQYIKDYCHIRIDGRPISSKSQPDKWCRSQRKICPWESQWDRETQTEQNDTLYKWTCWYGM